jgi:peptidoglycan hydrolase CwlO-like protein
MAMATKRTFQSVAMLFVLLLLASTSTVFAAPGNSTTNQGSTPNGKPFQYIQGQISALQDQITAVETALQAQINNIYSQISTMQGQISDLQSATQSLESRVTANESAIAALQAAVASLNTQLSAVQAQIASNTGDIQALQAQANNLQSLINAHQAQITSLQQSVASINQFLANMVNMNCQAGQAIQDIGPNGIISCTQVGQGTGQLSSITLFYYFSLPYNSSGHANLSCPSGYTLSGGGYQRDVYMDAVSYVAGINSSWDGYQFVYFPYYSYFLKDAVSVTADYPFYNYNYYYVRAFFLPNNYSYSPFMFAIAKCMRTQ